MSGKYEKEEEKDLRMKKDINIAAKYKCQDRKKEEGQPTYNKKKIKNGKKSK